MPTIPVVLAVLILLAVLPTWPHSRSWGHGPSGGVGLLLLILVVSSGHLVRGDHPPDLQTTWPSLESPVASRGDYAWEGKNVLVFSPAMAHTDYRGEPMKNFMDEMFTAPFARRAGIALASSSAAMSIVSALFVPYAHPWPSLAWAVLACASAAWVAKISTDARSNMSDVISGVEAEPARASGALERGGAAKREIS